MTTTSQSNVNATPPSDDDSGGFTRLNPVDGLFLRAEHLAKMQQYTSDLAAAVGAGVGPGVVYGFTCALSKANNAVFVTGGLAFAAGQPLYSAESLSVSLTDVTPSADDFFVVEIVSETTLYGTEPVYGGLCEDPCGRGSGIQPYAAEGVKLQLRQSTLTGFGGVLTNRRNWLASKYFERERQHGGEAARSSNAPWLLPDVLGGGVQTITGRPWSDGTEPYGDAAVPLGVVWKSKTDGKWQLDVWTARRDLGDPTPMMAWQWRLGWRPRRVFMAQILQFQAQLAQAGGLSIQTSTPTSKRLRKLIDEAYEQVAKINSPKVPGVASPLEECRQVLEPNGVPSLPDLGFDELPPAGYLPVSFDSLEEAEKGAAEIFNGLDVRVRLCRADYVAHAVEQVQHMDRIPLTDARIQPKIDLLVPQVNLDDLKATMPNGPYGWSAFVRRRDEEQGCDEVEVFVWYPEYAHTGEEFAKRLADDPELPPVEEFQRVGTVSYPAREWAIPTDVYADDKSTWQKVHDLIEEKENELLGVIGYTQIADRQSLAAARASLFVIPSAAMYQPVMLPLTYALIDPDWPTWPPEAIVVGLAKRLRD
jgi:hypothetical protein